jgi:hypothetical protein
VVFASNEEGLASIILTIARTTLARFIRGWSAMVALNTPS